MMNSALLVFLLFVMVGVLWVAAGFAESMLTVPDQDY